MSASYDHVAVAQAAEAAAGELDRGAFLRHGPAPLLLRTRCHHVAAAAYLRAGDTAGAFTHAQEALRITCALFALLDRSDAGSGGGAKEPAASSDKLGRRKQQQGEQSPAAAAAAAVDQGAAASMQDFTVESDDEGDAVVTGGTQAAAGGLSSGSATAAQGPSGTSTSSPRLGGSLAWVVVSEHLASLHLAARSFEVAGSPEDAACLWRECHQTAGAFRVWGMQLLSCCGLAELACRRGDAEGAAAQLEASDCAWAQHKSECGDSRGANALSQLLHAVQQAARARHELLVGRLDPAVRTCEEGLKACEGVLAEDAGREATGRAEEGPGRCLTLQWQAVSLRCQVQRLKAEALARKGQRAEAVSLLQAAASCLQTAVPGGETRSGGPRRACVPAGGSRSSPDAAAVWPVDVALMLSHSAAVASEAGLHGASCSAGPAVVGLGCRSQWQRQAPSQSTAEDADVDVAVGDGATQSDQATKKGTSKNLAPTTDILGIPILTLFARSLPVATCLSIAFKHPFLCRSTHSPDLPRCRCQGQGSWRSRQGCGQGLHKGQPRAYHAILHRPGLCNPRASTAAQVATAMLAGAPGSRTCLPAAGGRVHAAGSPARHSHVHAPGPRGVLRAAAGHPSAAAVGPAAARVPAFRCWYSCCMQPWPCLGGGTGQLREDCSGRGGAGCVAGWGGCG